MKPSMRRLAQSISSKPLNLREANATLMPPKPLYRAILRSHRNLPSYMRSLGDTYVRDEFRRHRTVVNPVHIIGFLSQWKTYLETLPNEHGAPFQGKKLDSQILEKMSAEQIGQLYELMQATKDVFNPHAESGKDDVGPPRDTT